MPTQVMFYVFEQDADDSAARLRQACQLAADFYRQNQKVFIFTENQANAEAIDELLWAFEADSFVPHNLAGEGPSYGAPVEISWLAPTNRRPVLINLTNTVPGFANQFAQLVDFVPAAEQLKQQARERFRAYRQWGFVVDTQPVVSQTPAQSPVKPVIA